MPYQHALAAIAVVLGERFNDFSEEYLIDLARVRTTRLAMASRVARVCLQKRSRYARTTTREFVVDEEPLDQATSFGVVLFQREASTIKEPRIPTHWG